MVKSDTSATTEPDSIIVISGTKIAFNGAIYNNNELEILTLFSSNNNTKTISFAGSANAGGSYGVSIIDTVSYNYTGDVIVWKHLAIGGPGGDEEYILHSP